MAKGKITIKGKTKLSLAKNSAKAGSEREKTSGGIFTQKVIAIRANILSNIKKKNNG